MKSPAVRTFVVGNPWKNWVFVKVYTDEGIVGLGEATRGSPPRPAEAAVHELKPLSIGQDPRDVVAVWDRMYKGPFLGQHSAMTAIELACWDILGKSRRRAGLAAPRREAQAASPRLRQRLVPGTA